MRHDYMSLGIEEVIRQDTWQRGKIGYIGTEQSTGVTMTRYKPGVTMTRYKPGVTTICFKAGIHRQAPERRAWGRGCGL